MTMKVAFDVIFGTLTDPACRAISKLCDLNAISNRVVHGA